MGDFNPNGSDLESFFRRYEIVTQIGSGCFGQIFKVVNLKTNAFFSLKKVMIDSGYFNRELSILLKIRNTEGVLHLLDFALAPVAQCLAFLSGPNSPRSSLATNEVQALTKVDKKYENVLYLVTKCYPTNLRSAIIHQKLTNKQARLVARSLCLGVFNLHRQGVCHRDIKSENILVDFENNDVCVADLGSAKEFTPEAKGGIAYICSRPYRAPELLLGHTDYDFAIDLWSIGCIIFEVLSLAKKRLFTGDSGKNVLLEIIGLLGVPTKDDLEGLNEKRSIKLVSDVMQRSLDSLIDPTSEPALVQLMRECLRWNPRKRADLNKWVQSEMLSKA